MKNNKAALVTGGAKRIGREIVLSLAKKGYDIALHYNNSYKEAKEVASEVKKIGQRCVLYKCEFLKENKFLSLIKEVKKTFPNLILLINNASIFKEGKLIDTDISLFERTFNINVKTPFFLSKSFAIAFKKGHIINMLDTRITKNKTKYFAYVLSKKMLYELTKMTACDLAPNIRVNAIAPGPILPPLEKDKKYLIKIIKNIPLKQKGSINNILQALDFLLNNNYITGQCIFIDGGANL